MYSVKGSDERKYSSLHASLQRSFGPSCGLFSLQDCSRVRGWRVVCALWRGRRTFSRRCTLGGLAPTRSLLVGSVTLAATLPLCSSALSKGVAALTRGVQACVALLPALCFAHGACGKRVSFARFLALSVAPLLGPLRSPLWWVFAGAGCRCVARAFCFALARAPHLSSRACKHRALPRAFLARVPVLHLLPHTAC